MLLFLYMKWSLAGVLAFIPSLVSAQTQGFVQCGYDRMCNACDLILLVNNLVTWLFSVLAIFAVLALMVAGFRLVVSGGNTNAWEGAKQMFTNVVIGFVIIISAWLIVDTIMKAFLDPSFKSGFGMWNSLDGVSCEAPLREGCRVNSEGATVCTGGGF